MQGGELAARVLHALPPARLSLCKQANSPQTPQTPQNERATGVPVLPDGQEHFRHGHVDKAEP